MNWSEHVCIVTGAGSGIGKGVAEVFAEAGAAVVVAEYNAESGQAVADELQSKYGKAKFVHTNVAVAAECERMISQTVEAFGHVDTLVNNAGINFVTPTLDCKEADWDRIINVDLKGTFLCSQYALAHMVPRKSGTIVNISSPHAYATLPGAAPYAAAKGGVKMMTCAMAIEFAPMGIRINSVSPGLTDTQIWQDIQDAAEDAEACRQHWFDNIPMERVQSPQEVGKVCKFLASDESSFMTGSDILTDGAMTVRLINKERFASKAIGT